MDKNIIINTVIPLWSMDKKSGGKALYSTVKCYLENEYNVFFITDQENNYAENELNLQHIYYINMKWKDKCLKYKLFNIWGMRKVVNWLYCFIYEKKSFKVMKSIIKQNNKAIIYAYEVNAVKSCKKISKKYALPLVTRFQGTVMMNKKKSLYNKIVSYPHIQALSTKSDLVIMTDDGTMGNKVLSNYNNTSKTLFLRNGVNVLSKEIPIIDKVKLKKELGIPLNKTILLTVSRLVKWKRVERSINALSNLENKERYFLIVVGEGEERDSLEKLVKERKLEKYVKFMGAIKNEEVYQYMEIADIFLSFYDLSNVGNPLLEALALGKPIITYNVGDTYTVINEKNGILLNDVSPANIAKAIEDINEPKKLEYYQNGAKQYSKNNLYSWEERMKIEREEVEKLLDRGEVSERSV